MPSPLPIPVPLPPEFTESFLIVGESGTGKTQFSGTFPRPWFIDTDKGTRTLGRGFENKDTFIEAPFGVKPRPGMYQWGTAWAALMKRVDEIGQKMDKGEWPYDTLVFDSLTTLQEIALSAVLKAAGSRWKQGDPVDPGLWYAQQNLIQTLVATTRGWPGLKVFTAHVQKDTNDVTQTIEKLPLVTGKLAGKLPIYFDEIYFTEVRVKGEVREYVLRAYTDSVHRSARTRLNIPQFSNQDFPSVIWPALNA